LSRRRTKKQQKVLEEGLMGLLGLVAVTSYLLTKSLLVTGISIGGAIILIISIVVYQNNKQKEMLRNSGIKDIDSMDGIQFEYYLKELYLSKGYEVEVTSASGDYGADLLLNDGAKKVVVQAKRYSKDVGIKAVQEVIGAKSYYTAQEAWVVSNSYFTKAAKALAQKSNVLLVDRDELIDSIPTINPTSKKPSPLQPMKTVPCNHDSTCSKCGSPMILKNGKRGEFLGCSSFPKCRNTKNVG
jgi:restriction system protein